MRWASKAAAMRGYSIDTNTTRVSPPASGTGAEIGIAQRWLTRLCTGLPT